MSSETLSTNSVNTNNPQSNLLSASAELLGRIGLIAIFLLAGINKLQGYEGTAQYMASYGLPEFLLPLVIILEIGGALAILIGFQTRLIALALAGFCIASAILFHGNLSDQMQFIMFFKNIGLAGGFLLLVAHGAGRFSLDKRLQK